MQKRKPVTVARVTETPTGFRVTWQGYVATVDSHEAILSWVRSVAGSLGRVRIVWGD